MPAGSLSALATSAVTCHRSVSDNVSPKAGMPDRRMPCVTFQYVVPCGSSVTISPGLNNCGGSGDMPLAIAEISPSGTPWHITQFRANTFAPAASVRSSIGSGFVCSRAAPMFARSAACARVASIGSGAALAPSGTPPMMMKR